MAILFQVRLAGIELLRVIQILLGSKAHLNGKLDKQGIVRCHPELSVLPGQLDQAGVAPEVPDTAIESIGLATPLKATPCQGQTSRR
jgi:hypothetical protein